MILLNPTALWLLTQSATGSYFVLRPLNAHEEEPSVLHSNHPQGEGEGGKGHLAPIW